MATRMCKEACTGEERESRDKASKTLWKFVGTGVFEVHRKKCSLFVSVHIHFVLISG